MGQIPLAAPPPLAPFELRYSDGRFGTEHLGSGHGFSQSVSQEERHGTVLKQRARDATENRLAEA